MIPILILVFIFYKPLEQQRAFLLVLQAISNFSWFMTGVNLPSPVTLNKGHFIDCLVKSEYRYLFYLLYELYSYG